jgi:hypothetical protein
MYDTHINMKERDYTMKKLFLAITIPVLVILGTPAFIATLMYDGTGEEHMPTYLYTDEYDAKEMLFQELNQSIENVEDGTTSDWIFHLHSDVINRAIYEAILEENPNYAPGDDCQTDDECFIYSDLIPIEGYDLSVRVVGMWVSFYEGATSSDPGRFTFNIYLEVNLNGGTSYKTVVELHFLFDDNPEYYYLEFDKVQMGRLPIPKSFFTSIINMIEQQTGADFESQIGDLAIGELDLDNLSYTIRKDEILAAMVEDENGEIDPNALLAQELMAVVFDNRLVTMDVQDDQFVFTVGVSKFRSTDTTDIPSYLYDLHDQTIVDGQEVIGEYNPELFDADDYLKSLFAEFVFNNALIGGGFEISEETFNKLIYANMDGFTDTRDTVEIDLGDGNTKIVEVGLKAIWFEFEPDGIYAKALFRISGVDSLLVLRADQVSSINDELHFEFVNITVGYDQEEVSGDYLEIDDMDAFKAVFAEIGDVEFGTFDENGDLIITADQLTALMQDGSAQGAVQVSGIYLKDGSLVLDIEPADPTYQSVLNTFQDAVTDVLGDEQILTDLQGVIDPNDGGTEQAVYEAVESIQAAIADPNEDVSPEQIEELFSNFEELDTQTQEEFLNTIVDAMDPSILIDFENLFGEFGPTDDSGQ